MTRFYTSDPHLFSEHIIRTHNRPFKSAVESVERFIAQWKSQVKPDDTVEFLGDFMELPKFEVMRDVLSQLPGIINFTMGNKDNLIILQQLQRDGYINEVNTLGKTIYVDDLIIQLTHYPLDLGARKGIINFHGHIHARSSLYPNQLNVSVDSPLLSYKPFFYLASEEELLRIYHGNKHAIDEWYNDFDTHLFCSPFNTTKQKKNHRVEGSTDNLSRRDLVKNT